MRPLSYRQRLFVEFYLGESSGSAVDAARRAGYRWPTKLGARLVEKREVKAAIDARVATAAMAANEVLARVARLIGVSSFFGGLLVSVLFSLKKELTPIIFP